MKIFNILIGQKKSIFRDPMSFFIMCIPFLLYILVKFALPVISTYINPWINLYLYYDLIKLVLYLIIPMLLGMVSGFLLIDEKDMEVLSFIEITPYNLKGYIGVKCALGFVIGFLYNFIFALLIRDNITISLFFMFFLASLLVPYFALFIFTFSKNKVEGLTKGKLVSFIIIAAVIPYFVSNKWINLLLVFPTFWAEKVYFSNNNIELFTSFILGIIVSCVSIVFFIKKIKNT